MGAASLVEKVSVAHRRVHAHSDVGVHGSSAGGRTNLTASAGTRVNNAGRGVDADTSSTARALRRQRRRHHAARRVRSPQEHIARLETARHDAARRRETSPYLAAVPMGAWAEAWVEALSQPPRSTNEPTTAELEAEYTRAHGTAATTEAWQIRNSRAAAMLNLDA